MEKAKPKEYGFAAIPSKFYFFIEGKKFYNLLNSIITYCEVETNY